MLRMRRLPETIPAHNCNYLVDGNGLEGVAAQAGERGDGRAGGDAGAVARIAAGGAARGRSHGRHGARNLSDGRHFSRSTTTGLSGEVANEGGRRNFVSPLGR